MNKLLNQTIMRVQEFLGNKDKDNEAMKIECLSELILLFQEKENLNYVNSNIVPRLFRYNYYSNNDALLIDVALHVMYHLNAYYPEEVEGGLGDLLLFKMLLIKYSCEEKKVEYFKNLFSTLIHLNKSNLALKELSTALKICDSFGLPPGSMVLPDFYFEGVFVMNNEASALEFKEFLEIYHNDIAHFFRF